MAKKRKKRPVPKRAARAKATQDLGKVRLGHQTADFKDPGTVRLGNLMADFR